MRDPASVEVPETAASVCIISNACCPTLRSSAAVRCSSARLRPGPESARRPNCRPSRRQRRSTFGFTSQARATWATGIPIPTRHTARLLELLRELPARQSHGPILLSLKIVPYLVVSTLGSTPLAPLFHL